MPRNRSSNRCTPAHAIFIFFIGGFCSLFICAGEGATISFKPVITYETDPSIVGLGRPGAMSIDAQGKTYVLDVIMRQAHVWDVNGRYLRSFGKEGHGPGEFSLTTQSGDITVLNDHVIVVDEAAGKIHFFDLATLAFKRTIARPSYLSRFYVYATQNGNWFAVNYSTSRIAQKVLMLNSNFEVKRELVSRKFDRFEWIDGEKFIYRPLSNYLRLSVGARHVYVGETRSNLIQVFDENGEALSPIRFPGQLREITDEEREEYRNELRLNGRQDRARLELHDKAGMMDLLLPMDDYLLIARRYNLEMMIIEGEALNKQHEFVGRFKTSLGDMQAILSFRNRLVVLATDNDGEHRLTAYAIQREPE